MKSLLTSALLALVLLFAFYSCGSRKSSTTTNEKSKDSITIVNQYSQNSKTVLYDIFTARPVDALRPMWIDGKEYKNAVISNDKSKSSETKIDVRNTTNIYRTFDINRVHTTQRVDSSNLYIGLFIVFGIFIVVYLVLKKYNIL